MSDSTSSDLIKFGFTPRKNNWTSLRLLNVYRVGIASIFFSQSFIKYSPLLYIHNLPLYAWVSFAYLLLSLVMTIASWIERRHFQRQVTIQTYFDIIAIILLMHSCGGISSGLGMLLIVSIAVSGLLGKDSLATIFASLATVGLLAEFSYSITYTNYSGTSTQVGLLGAALFATALVTQSLTQRISSSEALIQKQKLDVANLSALNAEILQNMQSGVIALDGRDQVRHINDMARHMVQADLHQPMELPFDLKRVLPGIYQALQEWRSSPNEYSSLISSDKGSYDIQVNFHDLHSRSHQGTLIFIDDISQIKQKMQQAKLASLGHLTASIAHEIRNPLGAISHAAQLLAENKELPTTESRLTEIIQQHSSRINHIIEDIMQLSRGHVASLDHIVLKPWLEQFIESFCMSIDSDKNCFNLKMNDLNAEIFFDSSHLNRILTNLCQNAKTHGNSKRPIYIKVYRDPNKLLSIEVADQGKGIKSSDLDKIFEPFYTTGKKGSGLGLYIVSQLCDLNDANISATKNEFGGSSFIITK
jgi:two-component system sensor histidine kinase PilS (NtrC family)